MILAIDTASYAASIAILRDGEVIESLIYSSEGHAHRIFQEIEALLARAGASLDEVDCFAAASGPGSFTGVRVALSAAKGLAEACGKPMVAVSNLRALAWFGQSALRAPIIDARRGEVYTALYDGELRLVSPEVVKPLETIAVDAERIDTVPANLARAVAHIAQREFAEGRAVDPAAVDANYVRPPDIRAG